MKKWGDWVNKPIITGGCEKVVWGNDSSYMDFFQEPLCETVIWHETKQSKAKQQISHDVYLPMYDSDYQTHYH